MNNEVVKKTDYDGLIAKVNAVNTSGFFFKTQYSTGKLNLEKKINDADKKIPDAEKKAKYLVLLV